MSIIKSTILVNKLLDGTMLAAALQTYLGTAANLSVFNTIMTSEYECNRLSNSTLAMTALVGSALAMGRVVESTPMKMAIYSSKIACDLIAASTTAIAAMRASTTYHITTAMTSSVNAAVPGCTIGSKYLIVGFSPSTAAVGTLTIYGTADSFTASTSTSMLYITGSCTAVSSALADKISLCVPMGVSSVNVMPAGDNLYVGYVRCDGIGN